MSSTSNQQLRDQLDEADRHKSSLQAWFQLKADQPGEAVPSPERTKELAKDLVDRASSTSGEDPETVQVLDQLGSLRVKAGPGFLRALSDQPEVLTARATNLPGFELIRPVKEQPVQLHVAANKAASRRKAGRNSTDRRS